MIVVVLKRRDDVAPAWRRVDGTGMSSVAGRRPVRFHNGVGTDRDLVVGVAHGACPMTDGHLGLGCAGLRCAVGRGRIHQAESNEGDDDADAHDEPPHGEKI